jgi:DNA-binding NarL/FixJ family response regulator
VPTNIEQALRDLPSEVGLHCSRVGRPWALVRKAFGHTTVYIWALDEPYPSVAEVRARFPLTPRQAQVALMLFARRTNTEIAAELGISVNTAKRHVEAVLLRLGVRSRQEVEHRLLLEVHGTG